MRNYLAKVTCCGADKFKNHKVVQLVKTDEDIEEFSTPILVKDALVDFLGFGISLSRNTPLRLGPNYKLRLGHKYYLVPAAMTNSNIADHSNTHKVEKEEDNGGFKRIKVVITKQQLRELLERQVSPEDILSALDQHTTSSGDDGNSATYWKPILQSIPEGNELI